MWALIKAGIVDNVIVADAAFIEAHGEALADGGQWIDVTAADPRPGPGWVYDKGAFAPPVVD